MAKEFAAPAALRELARRTPAIMMERANCRTVRPIPAEAESRPGTIALIWGAKLLSAAVIFVEARLHALFKGMPTKGQVSTPAGGGGIIGVPSLRCAERVWIPPINVLESKTTGTINKASSRRVITKAAKTPA